MSQSKMEHNNHLAITDIPANILNTSNEHSPVLLAISRVMGSSLYVKKFDTSIKYDEQLVGIGIHAFRIFLLDSFKRKNISNIKIDEMTVKMVNLGEVIVYYIYTGQNGDEETKFNNFIDKLVNLDCWKRFRESEYSVYKKDTNSISSVVEEIFAG